MKTRWLVALVLGAVLLAVGARPTFAGFEGGDPGKSGSIDSPGHDNPNNNHVDPDHGPKP